MNAASFKDLCMDAGDALAQARFWASVLGSRLVDLGDGSARLDPAPGRPNRETIWIDPVPEPRTVKTRVHVDLRLPGADPAAILQAGATVVREPGEDPWWAQVSWWAGVTGGNVQRPDEGTFAWVEGAAGFPWQYWVFTQVPEPKAAKNRVHWDVDLTGPDPGELVEAGAAVLRKPGGDISWWVLADPEGNEFCAFPPER